MAPRTKRTLYRLLSLFLAAGAGDAVVQFAVTGFYDWRHLAGALVVAAVAAIEKFLSESDSTIAAPTVNAVDSALENQAASVSPPKIATPDPALTVRRTGP